MHNPDLTGKVAAITGASSGIGEATAETLARAGAAVSLAARRSDRIEALAEKINGAGGRAIATETDVGNEEQANAFVNRTNEELGRLDILVNNAGVMLLGPVVGKLMGFPPNLRELIRTSDGVTSWAKDDKARRELGYAPRDMDSGLRQTLAAA